MGPNKGIIANSYRCSSFIGDIKLSGLSFFRSRTMKIRVVDHNTTAKVDVIADFNTMMTNSGNSWPWRSACACNVFSSRLWHVARVSMRIGLLPRSSLLCLLPIIGLTQSLLKANAGPPALFSAMARPTRPLWPATKILVCFSTMAILQGDRQFQAVLIERGAAAGVLEVVGYHLGAH